MPFIKKSLYLSASLLAFIPSAWTMMSSDFFEEDKKTPSLPSSKKATDDATHADSLPSSGVPSSSQKQQIQQNLFTGTILLDSGTGAARGKIRIPSEWADTSKEGSAVFISVPQPLEGSLGMSNVGGLLPDVLEEKLPPQPSQGNIFEVLGVPATEVNLAAYFFKVEALSKKVINNFYGPDLILNKATFHLNPQSALIFDALTHVKSVKNLSLVGAQLDNTHYMALINALARNRSIKRIDLTKVSFSEEAFALLGVCLGGQKTIREIILRPQFEFKEKHVETFYESIKGNEGLCLIVWPEDKKIEKKIRSLADKGNRAAALHIGAMLATGILPQDQKEALKYLNKAYEGGHPLASYEIGHLKEKQGQFKEALEWYQKSASEGYARALVKMGDHYRAIWPKGNTAAPDYQKAHQNYKLAAAQENPKAIYRVGRMYEGGKFVEKSLGKAAHHFYQAIEWGYPDAFTALGALYNNPEYTDHDPATGRYYLEWGKRFKKTTHVATRMLTYTEPKKP